MILLISCLLLLILSAFGWIIQSLVEKTDTQQIGIRALTVAKTVAQIPEIRQAFQTEKPSEIIQPIAESIRLQTGAEFIVVADSNGIRYSHPTPSRIGQRMASSDNEKVRNGESVITEATGTLGPSLRGITPLFDTNGQMMGIVSVGFLLEDVEKITSHDRLHVLWLSLGTLAVGVLGAMLIASSVKRAIFGLEPQEIGRLYQEKQAVLESIREGIVAIDQQGHVTMVNQTAVQLLHLQKDHTYIGSSLLDLFPASRMMGVIRSGQAEYDQEMIVGDDILLVNRVPVVDHRGQILGAVSSFRDKSELSKVTEELSQVKQYAESLRAQTHEFSNKLYTISGLLQLESYQEAIDLITRESNVHQNLMQFLMNEIPDPMIGGLLIGKFNRANELKIQLTIDPDSTFVDLPPTLDRSLLVTILGNLIDNAMDAVLSYSSGHKSVNVFLTDLGEDLILEVEDSGIGVPEADLKRIYEVGYSTKPGKEHRGFGLALVKKAVQRHHVGREERGQDGRAAEVLQDRNAIAHLRQQEAEQHHDDNGTEHVFWQLTVQHQDIGENQHRYIQKER